MKCKHTNKEQVGGDYGYTGSVAVHPYTDENRSAHGGVTWTQRCRNCGSTRNVNSNGHHEEYGPWSDREGVAR